MKLIKTLFYGMLSIPFTGMADYVEPTEYAWPSEYYITDEYNELIFVLRKRITGSFNASRKGNILKLNRSVFHREICK